MNLFWMCLFVVIGASLHIVRCFKCPGDGQFNHPTQCDKFYECKKGKSRERLCPDGLVFSETIHSEEKCDRPFNVNCGNRTELQPPKSKSKQCRRKNGVFAHPDPSVCETYYNCADEEAQELNCPTGLWFDEKTGGCVWPHSSDREGCKTPAERKAAAVAAAAITKSDDGESEELECTGVVIDKFGQTIAHPKYPHPTDCQKFYICLNGLTKQESRCAGEEVFNETTSQCDEPANVPGCEDWVAIAEEPADDKKRK